MAGGEAAYDEGVRGPFVTVFSSDPSAEAQLATQALRASGYAVVDVPLSMLIARVAVQRPNVILVDADGDGALDVVTRLRELPGADDMHLLLVARSGGVIASAEEALAHEASGLFIRPVDVAALLNRVAALTGGPRPPSRPPGSSNALPPPAGDTPPRAVSIPSLPPPSIRTPSTMHAGAEARTTAASGRSSPSRTPPVSSELQQLLEDAEQRIDVEAEYESIVPSPEDEIEAVLPAELLATLDVPLEEEDDDDEVLPHARFAPGASATRERPSEGGAARTPTGSSSMGWSPAPPGTWPARSSTGVDTLTPPPGEAHGGTPAGATGGDVSTSTASEPHRRLDALSPGPLPSPAALATSPVPPPTTGSAEDERAGRGAGAVPFLSSAGPERTPSTTLGPGQAIHIIARAIASRTTGSLCIAAAGVERRVVLREGDVVTSASTAEDESLLAFLGVRGDLPRETVRRLGSKFPPFGRYAGAALVARGYLRQDQMWPTLRAHAEWVLARSLQTSDPRLALEAQPPERLGSEPSVFGGSTGAEVFIEILRRIVSPAEAIDRLGGAGSHVSAGTASGLLAECALDADQTELVQRASGRTLREVLGGVGDSEMATVLFALAELGVIEVLPSVGPGANDGGAPDLTALDADAVRERVRARLQLVDDGDYFAVLGVARDATGYEVRRAFLDLRRAFDTSRVLVPAIVDLADDVRKITGVLEEAYEILKDSARRERYRLAIEAPPER